MSRLSYSWVPTCVLIFTCGCEPGQLSGQGQSSTSDGGVPRDGSSELRDARVSEPLDGSAAIGDASLDGSTTTLDAGVTTRDSGVPPRDSGPPPPPRDSGVTPQPTCAGPPGRTIRTLFVGNSQIEFWELDQIVQGLSEGAPAACPRIVSSAFAEGGANLRMLRTAVIGGRTLDAALASGEFDAVVLAESIDLVEVRPAFPAQFIADASELIETARAYGVVPYLYASPYVPQPGHMGFQEMAQPQIELGAELGVAVATGGLAWLRVWAEQPAFNFYHTDGQHPNYKGSMLSGMVIWGTITGGDPTTISVLPDVWCDASLCPPIPASEASLLARAARDELASR